MNGYGAEVARMHKEFTDRLRTRRQLLGISQSSLAKQCHVTQSHISHIECGRRSVSFDVLAPMLRMLGLELRLKIK